MPRSSARVAAGDAPTGTQFKLLQLLGKAYVEDIPCHIAGRTKWHGTDMTAHRHVAAGLVQRGLARFSEPEGRFLLISDAGKTLVAGTAAA